MSKKKITGQEPLANAYLNILFNKKNTGHISDKQLEK